MKNKLLKFVLSRWYLLIGITLGVLFIMPANSPIHLPYPEYSKPIVAMITVYCIMDIVFFKHEPKEKK
jgi:hypothetical protein